MSSLGEMSFGSQLARFASESDLPAQSPISDNAANASGERYSVEMNSLIQMIKETIYKLSENEIINFIRSRNLVAFLARSAHSKS